MTHIHEKATEVRPRRVSTRPFPTTRRMSIAALKAGRRRSPMYGLIEVDATQAHRIIAASTEDLSFTAFVVGSVARAAGAHPEVHAYRDWRGRLVTHSHVDVNTLVEVQTDHGPFPLAVVIRDADVLSVGAITRQLRAAKADPSRASNGRLLVSRTAMAFARLPGLAAALFRLGGRTIVGRRQTGTVSVTAVGMFGAGAGWGLGGATIYSLGVVVGGLSSQPRFVDGDLEPRQILNLTVTVDHNMVDGAPAARFVADLKQTIESARALGRVAA